MKNLQCITFDPNVMGGKPTIRGLRVTLGTIIDLIAAGHNNDVFPNFPSQNSSKAIPFPFPL